MNLQPLTPLTTLSLELLQLITSYVDIKSVCILSQCCKALPFFNIATPDKHIVYNYLSNNNFSLPGAVIRCIDEDDLQSYKVLTTLCNKLERLLQRVSVILETTTVRKCEETGNIRTYVHCLWDVHKCYLNYCNGRCSKLVYGDAGSTTCLLIRNTLTKWSTLENCEDSHYHKLNIEDCVILIQLNFHYMFVKIFGIYKYINIFRTRNDEIPSRRTRLLQIQEFTIKDQEIDTLYPEDLQEFLDAIIENDAYTIANNCKLDFSDKGVVKLHEIMRSDDTRVLDAYTKWYEENNGTVVHNICELVSRMGKPGFYDQPFHKNLNCKFCQVKIPRREELGC